MSILQKIKYLPRVLSLFEKRIILILFIIAATGGGLLLYKFYDKHREFVPASGGVYTEGLVGQPKFLNPLLSPNSDVDSDITRLVFSSLLKYNKNQELVMDLAERYEITPDQKNYIFHLKKGIMWHDGKELNADDIIFTFQNIVNPDYQSPYAPNFKDIKIEKIDQYTVKFLLPEASTSFIFENTTFGILPRHIWEKIPAKSAALAQLNLNPQGSGPFKFKEYQKNEETGEILSFTLSRNENYFDQKPYLKEIAFKFYKNSGEVIKAFNQGKIQGIGYIPFSEKNNIKKTKKINFYSPLLSRYYAIFLNYAKNNLLEDRKIRQALAYSLDRKKIVDEALSAQAEIVNSPILPYHFAFNPKVKKYPHNLKKAKEILRKSGWRKNKDKILEHKQTKKKLEISLVFPSQEEFPKIAQIIKESWEKLGVEVKLKAQDPQLISEEIIRPRNYQALLFGQLQTHDPDPYLFWHSDEREDPGLNLTSYKNKTIDELLSAARKTKNEKERKKMYFQFQDLIAKNIPAIFLYSPKYLYGVKKNIKGIELNYLISPSDRFADIENWYINVKRKFR
ncbi:MAG: ABC transporter substrate-binding protein [Patescibacteria group bacterium]